MKVEYTKITDKLVMLTKDLHYCFRLCDIYSGDSLRDVLSKTGLRSEQGLVITAPAGFVCDLASVPSALQPMFAPDGEWAPAAVIHDLLYQNNHKGLHPNTPLGKLNALIGKDFADKIFLHAMVLCGVNIVTRRLFYRAVQYFGDTAYLDANEDIRYPEPAKLIKTMDEPYEFVRGLFEPGIPTTTRLIYDRHKPTWFKYPNLKRPLINHFDEVSNVLPELKTAINC